MRQIRRTNILAFAIAPMLIACAASTAFAYDIGACVTPKVRVDHSIHRLIQKFIDVFAKESLKKASTNRSGYDS